MESERLPVRSNLLVYEGEYVTGFLLGCIRQTCYVMLKKGTIYFYDSKRSCLNDPQKPKLFFNLNTVKLLRDGHWLHLEDPFCRASLWSNREEDVSMLEENANHNRAHLEVQKIFPKKFQELNSRIDQKMSWQKPRP